MPVAPDPQAALREFAKTADSFVGIDSDGCVFDTMEVKHKESDNYIHSLICTSRKLLFQNDLRHALPIMHVWQFPFPCLIFDRIV